MRLRSTAPPVFLVTVKPARASPAAASAPSGRRRACRVRVAALALRPSRSARKSCRLRSLSIAGGGAAGLMPSPGPADSRRQTLATARPARSENLAATLGRQAGAEAVTALADELGGLIGAFHGTVSAVAAGCRSEGWSWLGRPLTRKTRPGGNRP